jgi:manganese/zinc/iron transport system permease protein
MTADALLIILTGAAVAGSCALLGSFLVLRKMSMLGDAISHAVLPGIVVAFLITGSRGSLVMFVGAVVFGLITTFLVQFLSDKGVQGDASIGVAFTFLFAIGIVLISIYGEHVDLDLDCVLYGEIAYTPFDVLIIGGQSLGPRPLWINTGLLLLNLAVVMLFYKQFKICAFDPAMAAAVGINVTVMHYLLMLMVSVTTVGAFESVGAILVVAMLIVPAATAYLLTERLGRMLAIAVGLGIASSVLGYYLASAIDASIAGSMATISGVLFLLAFLFSPLHGIVSKMLAHAGLRRRVADEDALLWAWRRGEMEREPLFASADLASGQGWHHHKASAALSRLRSGGFVKSAEGEFTLSDAGRHEALELIRRHRLYESYLGEIGYSADHVHEPADRVEHFIDEELARRVEQVIENPETDPHGKRIPDREPR